MENIIFDVDQLAPPNRTDQAQCLQEEAEYHTGDVHRAAVIDPATLSEADQQRQDQVEMQHKKFAC
jgi:hypothetical protein